MENENTFKIVLYTDDLEKNWDDFVENESVNGTFLQTRRFLNYHPKDRFTDNSYMIIDQKNNFVVAVIPACVRKIDGKKVLVSHSGSTFGGIIISKKYYVAHKVIDIIDIFEEKVKEEKFDEVFLKSTPSLFAKDNADLLEYCLYFKDYEREEELNSYIDFADYKEDILSNFAQGKRTNVNNCLKKGIELKKIESEEEISSFYDILCETLEKFDRKPVHNLKELLVLKSERLVNECEFYGAFLDGKMIAGSMMFYFKNSNVAHTQYLCAKHEYDALSPMTYMYYAMIKNSRELGYDKISFGITSEHSGKELNFGLTKSKEAFGSKHSINRIFSKKF